MNINTPGRGTASANPQMGKPLQREFGFSEGGGTGYARRNQTQEPGAPGFFGSVTPWKMIALCLLIGAAGYLYISHVFYTQKLLAEVQQMRSQHENARIDHTDAQLTYERMTGPAEVYQRARSLGLIDGGPADRIVTRN